MRRVKDADAGIKGGEGRQRQAGGLLVNGVKEENEAAPSNMFGILDKDTAEDDDIPDGMPESVARTLREIRNGGGKA